TALFVAALPGLAVAALLFLTVRDPLPAHLRKSQTAGLGSALMLLGRTSSLRWLTLAFACQTFGLFATGAWLPSFFMRAHALPPVEVGLALGLAVGIGGAIGALGVGFLCDHFRRSGRPVDWQLAMLVI